MNTDERSKEHRAGRAGRARSEEGLGIREEHRKTRDDRSLVPQGGRAHSDDGRRTKEAIENFTCDLPVPARGFGVAYSRQRVK